MTPQPTPHLSADPTLAVAERQLVLLGELVEIAMTAARAFGESALAAAKAEKTILGEEWFTPEVGRARACGAKDAAESIQKVTRAARLTMKLEMAVAEIVRDIRAGIVTHPTTAHCNAGENPSSMARAGSGARAETPCPIGRSAGVLAGPGSADRDSDWTRSDTDTERLVEFDRAETLPRAPLRDIVEEICADLDVAVDWKAWKVLSPALAYDALRPPLPDGTAEPPPGIDLPP